MSLEKMMTDGMKGSWMVSRGYFQEIMLSHAYNLSRILIIW